MSDNNDEAIVPTVEAVLKYNSVFLVTQTDIDSLAKNAYGAKQFRPFVLTPYQKKLEAAMNIDSGSGSSSSSSYSLNQVPIPGFDESEPLAALAPVDPTINDQNSNPVMLFDEEAFYLFSHNLIQIKSKTQEGEIVTEKELWRKFIQKNDKFPLKYKVYEYFRKQNFVVKTGIHFGLDYSVYRTLPTHCHSELCVIVVDSLQKRSIEDISDGRVEASGQIGWRHLSTLTRVMPDVMKLLGLCYVLPKSNTNMDSDSQSLESVFGLENVPDIDLTDPKCIDQLEVRLVTSLVRRLVVNSSEGAYQSIGKIQRKYRSCSILKVARQAQTVKRKRKKRRDHTEVREKKKSKHKAHWKALMRK